MKLARGALALLLAAFAAPLAAEDNKSADARPLRVTVSQEDEQWFATFEFPGNHKEWAFVRSNRSSQLDASWRLATWRIITPGVELVREGERDLLRATGTTMPDNVTVAFDLFDGDLNADYHPAMVFSDGTVALYTGHFQIWPWTGADGYTPSQAPLTELTFRSDDNEFFADGEKVASLRTADLNTYVIVGTPQLVTTSHFTAIIDPGIPAWMRTKLNVFVPRLLDGLAARLGPHGMDSDPTILATWAGPTPDVITRGGSVLPGMVTLRFEGEGMLEERADEIQPVRWFLAHETAHFWLGQTVRHPDQTAAWISEGGASLVAYRLIQSIDPAYEPGFDIAREWKDCIELSARGPLDEADNRRDYRASYACGTVLGMIAEGAAQQNGSRDFFDFWRSLIEANRRDKGGDGIVSVNDWIAQLTRESQDTDLAARVRSFIHDGSDDPEADLCAMLARVDRRAPGCTA